MADTETAAYAEDALLHPVAPSLRVFRHAIASAPALNDTFKFFQIPKNVKIGIALLATTDMDTGAALLWTLRLSDGTTTKNLISSVSGQAMGVFLLDEEEGIGFVTDSDDYYIEVLTAAAPGTFTAGTLTVMVTYTAVLDNGA